MSCLCGFKMLKRNIITLLLTNGLIWQQCACWPKSRLKLLELSGYLWLIPKLLSNLSKSIRIFKYGKWAKATLMHSLLAFIWRQNKRTSIAQENVIFTVLKRVKILIVNESFRAYLETVLEPLAWSCLVPLLQIVIELQRFSVKKILTCHLKLAPWPFIDILRDNEGLPSKLNSPNLWSLAFNSNETEIHLWSALISAQGIQEPRATWIHNYLVASSMLRCYCRDHRFLKFSNPLLFKSLVSNPYLS